MPIFNGKSIPFNATAIARLLYNGHYVETDEDVPPEQFLAESEAVSKELRLLWSDQKMRTVDSVMTYKGVEFPYKQTISNPFLFNTPVTEKRQGLSDLQVFLSPSYKRKGLLG